MATPKFLNAQRSTFHQELKRRVSNYFTESKKPSHGNFSLYFKAVLLWTVYIALYIHILFFTPVTWVAILECIVMGGLTAAIGFNVMHDGGHGSFSSNRIWNKIASFSANALGASSIMWNNKHNIIHHTYTNIDGIDDDIEIKPLLRMCSTQKKYFIHRFQHIYVWVLYTLLLLVWDSTVFCQSVKLDWAKQMKGSSYDVCEAVTIDDGCRNSLVSPSMTTRIALRASIKK